MKTPRQKNTINTQYLEAIKSYWEREGCSPAIRDLLGIEGNKSTGIVYKALKELESIGLIKRKPGKIRSIEIITQ